MRGQRRIRRAVVQMAEYCKKVAPLTSSSSELSDIRSDQRPAARETRVVPLYRLICGCVPRELLLASLLLICRESTALGPLSSILRKKGQNVRG